MNTLFTCEAAEKRHCPFDTANDEAGKLDEQATRRVSNDENAGW